MFFFKIIASVFVYFFICFSWARPNRQNTVSLNCKKISLIQQIYLSKHIKVFTLNKSLQNKIIHNLIQSADSTKNLFLVKDIKNINIFFKDLLANIKKQNCSNLDKFFELWQLRVKQRAKFVKNFLSKASFKINPNTSLSLDYKKRKRSKTTKQAEVYLSKYAQFQVTNLLETMKLKKAKQFIIRQYQRNIKLLAKKIKEEGLAIYLSAFATALDPHSDYFSWKALEDFQIEMSRSLEGIGAKLSFEDGFTVIAEVIEGGAVDRSGKLRAKDKILSVAQGLKGAFVNIIEMNLSDVVRKIRGKKGSKVRLLISRKTKSKTKKFEIILTRDKIPLERAKFYIINKKIKSKKIKLALIHLGSFYADWRNRQLSATNDLKNILKKIKKQKVKGIVLDLSNNGGGSLSDAVDISGLFFKTGAVVRQSIKHRKHSELRDTDPAVQFSGPLVVLTNRFSASASEIVSGALQDYHRAVIVGSGNTYGKGTVQTIEPLGQKKLGALKITIGMFYIPSGKTTQHQGVKPDILLPVPENLKKWGEAELDYSLAPNKIANFVSKEAQSSNFKKRWLALDKNTISFLNKKSIKRVKNSKAFKKFIKENKKLNKKNIKISTLLKEQQESKKEKIKETTNTISLRKKKLKKYMDRADVQESLNILLDLVDLQN